MMGDRRRAWSVGTWFALLCLVLSGAALGLVAYWLFVDVLPPVQEQKPPVVAGADTAPAFFPGDTVRLTRFFCATGSTPLEEQRILSTRERVIVLPSYKLIVPDGCHPIELTLELPHDLFPDLYAYQVHVEMRTNRLRTQTLALRSVPVNVVPPPQPVGANAPLLTSLARELALSQTRVARQAKELDALSKRVDSLRTLAFACSADLQRLQDTLRKRP